MKPELDLLIELYEEERVALETAMAEFIKEYDYRYASYHQVALGQVNRTLYHLYKMKISFYDDIADLERIIQIYKRSSETSGHEFLSSYWERRIEEQELKIEQLKNEASKPFYDGQIIDDALFDLIEGKLKGFQLLLKKSTIIINFKLIQEYIGIFLFVENPSEYYGINNDDEDDGMDEDLELDDESNEENENNSSLKKHRVFETVGFKPVTAHEFVYKYPIIKFRDACDIKILLSRLFYDVLNYNSKYESAGIVYY